MAKIIEGTLQPAAPPRSKGAVNIIRREHCTVAQKWPRKRGRSTQGGKYYAEWQFGLVGAWAANPEPIAMQSAMNMARGTDLVWRDWIVKASFGTAYDIVFDDGTPTRRYRDVTVNAQLTIDQITDDPGSIIWRADIGWVGLLPGNNGQVLTMESRQPVWKDAPSGGGGGVDVTVVDTIGPGTFTPTPGKTRLTVWAIGGGGGGGSGRQTAPFTGASGGAGGGGAAVLRLSFLISDIVGNITFNVGDGGAGGSSQGSANTNGSPGASGGATTFVVNGRTYTTGVASGGNAGTTATAVGGAGAQQGTEFGSTGGSVNPGAPGAATPTCTTQGAPGGGAGGGAVHSTLPTNGGLGGTYAPATGLPNTAAQGGIGSSGTPPQAAIEFRHNGLSSGGGAGGASLASGVGQDGTAGGKFGGGGGGGAASLNGSASGAGGKGGQGGLIFIQE